MNIENISWKLIDKYFTDNPNNLVSHHLESYNDFFKDGINRIFRENNPIRFIEREEDKNLSDKRNEALLYLGGKDGSSIYFGKPIIYDDNNSHYMYPNDARLRNNQENYAYATVKGSSVERYFKRQIELSTMYRTMENRNYLNVDDAIDALRKDEIKAFIWDSARLEYESRYSCEFICTGELFGRSSYALALKKGNPWLNKLSQQILILH